MKKYRNYIIACLIFVAVIVAVCFVPISVSKLIPKLEEQISNELDLDVHIEKLVLRLGPSLKLKTPIMHVMYKDGQKIAQFDGIKFYINYSSFLNGNPTVNSISAKKAIIKLDIEDDKFVNLHKNLQGKDYKEVPNLDIKSYSLSAKTSDNELYTFNGNDFELIKVKKFKTFKLKSNGNFSINGKKHINYDLSIFPQVEISFKNNDFNILEYLNQIKELNFCSDIIADLKIYETKSDVYQASGFVNIDNISVLDPTQKNAKSFIYLTLWGDKASVLSNIYTSLDKKVYIEGMVNNSQKPILDLKVKTDDIDLDDLFKKIKIITGISKFKNLTYISGAMNANFSLKGDLNRLKSTGYMKIFDAQVKMNGLNINKINSDIDFNNNAIVIKNAIGYANNSPIMLKGKVDKDINLELLMSKVDLKYLCPAKYGISKGLISLNANIFGKLNNIQHKEKLLINDCLIEKDNYKLSLEELMLDTNKSQTAYLNNILFENKYTDIIKIPSMKLVFDGDNVKLPLTDIYMNNSKLTANADITNCTKDFGFNAIIKGFVNSKDINSLKNYSAKYPINVNIYGNRSYQNILSQVLLEQAIVFDEPTLVNLVAKYEKNSLKIEDLSMLSFIGKFADDFRLNLKGQKKLVISGFIDNLKKPVFKNIRIFLPQQLNLHFADTMAQIKGDIFLNGAINAPEIIGQATISNLFNNELQMAISNAILDFNKNIVAINIPMLKLNDTSLSLIGNMSSDFSKKISFKTLNIKSKYLNTDTLLMYKDLPIIKKLPIEINDGKFYSERLRASIYDTSIYLTAFASNFTLSDDVILLNNIASEMSNGKVVGALEYNLKDEHYSANIMGRNISAASIFDIISARKDTISGTMDFDMALKGELTSKSSLNGPVKFVVNNGRMSTLGKLEHLLYAQNVVADNMLRTSLSIVTKAITLKDTGLFKYLRGDVTLDKGIANINLLQSQGPLMALFIKGQYNTQTDYANLTVLGRLSDEIITGLGAFGDFSLNKLMIMLTGEDNKYNILPEDFDKIPQLPMKNTKEFRSIINGNIDKPSSVILFNWISYSQKSLKQKEVPLEKVKLPEFIDELPY